MPIGEIFMIVILMVWGIFGIITTLKYWKENGGFHIGWFIEGERPKLNMDTLKHFIMLIPFGILDVIASMFIIVFSIFFSSLGGPRPTRRNTDGLGRNYTDPYNQGRIDATNGSAPINPSDPNYMAGYNNHNNNQ